MPLGKTWWHGAIVKRQDSYGPDEGHPRARFDEAAWEATAAWEGMKWKLAHEATEFLAANGMHTDRKGNLSVEQVETVPAQSTDDETLLLAVVLILMM